ncbi:hypothetical protein KQI82_09650 [Oscillibacter sp. MSJ-2]|uniref:Uncharacterized protein n=1 Tax=Dysosmobacter acutus TaxID=2841504 RepID=A0ABS6FAT5_9FIRM|nr:hypothetical protein [Dysosmobacter acutus]MBU5627170.1 hypothetical protein [Dysosmobacter acutus]
MEACSQIFLTVNTGKWLIAQAVLELDCVKAALQSGKVVLKGGTTVSCISELLLDYPLKISGRLTPKGALPNRHVTRQAYGILVENGAARGIDSEVEECVVRLGPGDVVIAGANLIDAQGNAAVLAGSPGGFRWGRAMAAMCTEGARVIIPAGLEKLTPGSVTEAIKSARRKNIDQYEGMSCGLFPVVGDIITELEAVRLLADVEACVIGRGGIHGGEGGTLLQIHGEADELTRLQKIVHLCQEKKTGGDPVSLF